MATRAEPDDSQLVDNDELNVNIQPHIGKLEINTTGATALEYINPALDDTDDPPSQPTTSARVHAEQGINRSQNYSPENNSVIEPQVTIMKPTASNSNTTGNGQSFPVHFENSSNGTNQNSSATNSQTFTKPEVTSQSRVIQTRQLQNEQLRWNDVRRQRPLRKKHIFLIKVFSVIAAVMFFPTGIPAMYFAFRIQKEFDEGIMIGNIDKAQKFASRAERLIIFSGLFALLTAVIAFALIERSLLDDEPLVRNRIMP